MSDGEFMFWVVVGLLGAFLMLVFALLLGGLAVQLLLDIRADRREKRRPGYAPIQRQDGP